MISMILQPGLFLVFLPAGSTAQAGSGRSGSHAEAAVLPDSEEQRLSGAFGP